MSGAMSTALSALVSYQKALATTSHNVANVNTEGYSRQVTNFGTRVVSANTAVSIGSGVQVSSVKRAYDQYAVEQVRTYTSGFARAQTYATMAAQAETVISDSTSGVEAAMSRFFDAIQDVATDPSSTSARRVLINEGGALVSRLQDIDAQLQQLSSDVDARLRASVGEINGLATRIADLNKQIASSGSNADFPANDLLDSRDQAILELNKLVKVSTVTQADGAVNIFIGSGQSLVLGANAQSLSVSASRYDPTQAEITLPDGGFITSFIEGGSLGGLLDFRDEILAPARGQLGLLTYALGSEMNRLQAQGLDLSGNPGQDFFTLPGPTVQTSAGNQGSAALTAEIGDIAKLTGGDYVAVADGAGGYTLMTQPGGKAVNPADVGLTLTLSGSAAAGDSFLIRPTADVAAGWSMNLTQASEIAAAANDGSFGVGDNRNALAMVALEDKALLFGGRTSLASQVKGMVSDIATSVRSAETAGTAQATLLAQAEARQQSVSGVNLDEEAANLMKYQQAYSAAAQVAATANALFQTMLDAFRR